MSREEVELLVDEIDTSGDGEISCDELLQFVYDNTGGNAQTERERKELQDVFSLIDADGSGLLSADEVRLLWRGGFSCQRHPPSNCDARPPYTLGAAAPRTQNPGCEHVAGGGEAADD